MTDQAGCIATRPVLTAAEPHLFVSDMKASCGFFTGKLGLVVVFLYGTPPFYGQVKRDGARLNLQCVDGPVFDNALRARDQLLSAAGTVDSADEIRALYLEYQSAGVAFSQPLKREPWGAQNFVIADADGDLLLFADPAK